MTYDEFVRRWRRAMFAAADELHREFFDLYETREALAYFGRNLAVGGALCAAHKLAEEPVRTRRHVVGVTKGGVEMVTFEHWGPGCGWAPSEAVSETYSSCPTCGGPVSSAPGGCLGGDRGCGWR